MPYFLEFLFRHQRRLSALFVILGLIACAGLPGISISSDTRVFFARDSARLEHLEAFERTYSQNNNVLFVVAVNSGTLITPEHLATLADLTEAAWQLPHSIRVDSLTNFPHMTTIDDEFIIGDLLPANTPVSDRLLEEINRVAQEDPLLVDRLISKNRDAAGINVNFNLPVDGSRAVNVINAAALDLAATFRAQNPDLEIHVTGNVVLMKAFSNAAVRDIVYLFPFSLVVILMVLMITWKSVV